MPRKLRRFIQIDRKKIDEKKEAFTMVHTEREFNEKCRQNPEMKNVHYLIENQNHFVWQKSSGPVSKLNEFIIKQDEESIDEEEIFLKNKERVLIVSAEPGMGKSLILDHFTQNSTADNFYLKIILNTCTKSLKELKNNQKPNDWIDFVLKSLLNKNDQQEIFLLKHLAKKEKLILMFDGLDEVTDYKEQVIQLIDALIKDHRLKKILITTRNHLREELEDHFRTFSFNLNNFDDEDQKNFLVKYWRSLNLKFQERPTSAKKLMQSAEDLIERIKSISLDNLNELIGIPLQTKMLADIYFERVKNKQDFSDLILTNIAELYTEFIQSKIRIQYEEKSKIEIDRDQDRFDEDKEKFYAQHIKLSSSILFESSNNKEDTNLKERDEKRIIKYGVIVAFTNGVPTFLHQSFAEFFLAKSSLQKIIEQYKNDKELEQILRDKRHFLIRKFLNDLMQNQEYQKERNIWNRVFFGFFSNFNEEIENCCRENLLSLLKYLIEEKGANLKTKNEFLIEKSRNGHKEIVAFLLEKGIDVNQQDKHGQTALMLASLYDHKDIVEMLLQHKDIDINKQDKKEETALWYACSNTMISQMLLQHKKIQINKQNKYERNTVLIKASKENYKEFVEKLLQHKNIDVNKQNEYGVTALMAASQQGHKEIVQMLLQHKNIDVNMTSQGKEEVEQIGLLFINEDEKKRLNEWRKKDHQEKGLNATALMWASRNGHTEIVEILLRNKDIDVNLQDKLNGWTALMWASGKGHTNIVRMLLQHKNIDVNKQDAWGNTALMWASGQGHKEIAQMLLQHKNVDTNKQDKKGHSALMMATGQGNKEIVQMLLHNENSDVNQQGQFGWTALMWASQKGHQEIFQILLQHKDINVNQHDTDGDTALMLASRWGYREEFVQILLQHKDIDINHQDKDGKTALMKASEKGHEEIVQMLLQHKNINVNLQDKNGKTPLMWASALGHQEIVQMLEAKESETKINE
jgi:ankyrin repeat protein